MFFNQMRFYRMSYTQASKGSIEIAKQRTIIVAAKKLRPKLRVKCMMQKASREMKRKIEANRVYP